MNASTRVPVVWAIGGHDPTGGAGIQADIEAVLACGGQPATLLTALTAQNTAAFEACSPVAAEVLEGQARLLAADMPPAAIKIGLLPSPALAAAVRALLALAPGVPVVLDPVLGASSGARWDEEALCEALRALLPSLTVITPNLVELARLGKAEDPECAAEALMAAGCRYVLATDIEPEGAQVRNTLYSPTERLAWVWARLPHAYHGSGCTLAASLATFLAGGAAVDGAASLAQAYTYHSLKRARRFGRGQYHPHRLYRLEGLS